MTIRLLELRLVCRKGDEAIRFSPQISFFHGELSTGKSTIARLVDYCLGGKLMETPAIRDELVSVRLRAKVGSYQVLFERGVKDAGRLTATWESAAGDRDMAVVPLKSSEVPVVGGQPVYCLSDLIYYFMEVTPRKVRKSKTDPDSTLVRLSTRNILWYCYLPQDEMDSSFFHLEDPMSRNASRDVMQFVLGYYTERLTELETQLAEARSLHTATDQKAKQLGEFVHETGLGTAQDIDQSIALAGQELSRVSEREGVRRSEHEAATHFADTLRNGLRTMRESIAIEQQALYDLEEHIQQQRELMAELLTARMKSDRAASATRLLAGAHFVSCPSCGMAIEDVEALGSCPLCRRTPPDVDSRPALSAGLAVGSADILARV
jgi:rubrerythrin